MTVQLPPHNPDLASASTLPARAYTDPELYALERERIFARTWQGVGRCEQVRRPGDFFTCEVAGEPLVVLRDRDGKLRAFYNVCRHRAGPVAVGCGRRQSLTCQYHGWTYRLDGALLTTPEFEGVRNFTKEDHGLVPVSVATLGPIVFVNLARDAEPLDTVIGQLGPETAHLALDRMTMCERREYQVACNWKVYIDNYLEGYHVPLVHPGLYRELDYEAYRVETFRYHVRQHAPLRASSEQSARERPYQTTDPDPQALYYWVFPGWMFNILPGYLQFNAVLPVGVDRTLVIFEWYYPEGGAAPDATQAKNAARAAMAGGIDFGEIIQQEDIAICEEVQKRLGSRAYDRGRFCLKRENGVHFFQGLVQEFLARP